MRRWFIPGGVNEKNGGDAVTPGGVNEKNGGDAVTPGELTSKNGGDEVTPGGVISKTGCKTVDPLIMPFCASAFLMIFLTKTASPRFLKIDLQNRGRKTGDAGDRMLR